MRTKRLGDMLLELGLITEGQLKEALDYQAKEKNVWEQRWSSIIISRKVS
ncbi:MAG: hypothetical protein ACLR8P_12635 [Clostridium fessum]